MPNRGVPKQILKSKRVRRN